MNSKGHRWLWVLPAVALILAVVIVPFVFNIKISFYKWPILPGERTTFIGGGQYLRAFTDSRFGHSLAITLEYMVIAVPSQLILGFIIASALFRLKRGRRFLYTYLLIPSMIPPVTVGVIWLLLLSAYYGPINYILKVLFGVHAIEWLANPHTAFFSIVIADTWEWVPFMMIILYSGLVALPRDPYEAASLDGASAWQTFRYLTLPMLRSTIIIALILRTIDAFKIFDIIYVLTRGGPGNATESVSYYLYRTAFKFWNLSYTAALSLVLLVIVTLLITLYSRAIRWEE